MSTIENDFVVSIHYTLHDDQKVLLDSSQGAEPLMYLHGRGQIIPGLEKELKGKKVGDELKVTVSPEEGYGVYDASQIFNVPKNQFPSGAEVEVGSIFELQGPKNQSMMVRVKALEGDTVTLDANHPLAGKTLLFNVSVVEVRKATDSELEHGHAHGPGGHHHH